MRKRRAEKRIIKPDIKYNDVLVAKLINHIMYDGKKTVARKIVYQALEIAGKKLNVPALEVFRKAINNISPVIEVRSRRVGGATYQVPMEVRPERKIALAMRWLKTYARARGERGMAAKLAGELISAYNGEGAAVKKKDDTHRMAEANKAFAHFKW
ncbi:MAG TPA: 30S ribosomal protein S7 [Ignavibacteriales bacterium]|nr:30S ribosomal protein S7 [Ignavibacteriales bacterium]HOL80183.1 30S ribosomal protein S7 [Ignavibacteriales bacterium]HOM64465.1 30S ribosomal protein S7 [Ignavibacteriales bacterium]HPD68270.1 30S ribosomal protein S7 [Ignavibacteriales bacterium]HPP32372.1 30S ribosomal protein S7 [Ignavibacteriales bacterium]